MSKNTFAQWLTNQSVIVRGYFKATNWIGWQINDEDDVSRYLAVGGDQDAALGADVGEVGLVAADAVRQPVVQDVALLWQGLLAFDAQ